MIFTTVLRFVRAGSFVGHRKIFYRRAVSEVATVRKLNPHAFKSHQVGGNFKMHRRHNNTLQQTRVLAGRDFQRQPAIAQLSLGR